ncbi:hypothetical protein [Streptomyces xiamenensis]|uniref:hypothetical protein n=1 Tax=Streptomyces xiamenensis TaxID=408015 RepID=UPI0037D08344
MAMFMEPLGTDWVAPEPPPCPDCACCTARLCGQGRAHPMGCRALERAGDPIVAGCPCSAAETAGTAAHYAERRRAALLRERDGEAPSGVVCGMTARDTDGRRVRCGEPEGHPLAVPHTDLRAGAGRPRFRWHAMCSSDAVPVQLAEAVGGAA